MKLEYRLSLEIACEVKEKVGGFLKRRRDKNLQLIQEIINCILSHPQAIDLYYMSRLLEDYHPVNGISPSLCSSRVLEDYRNFWYYLLGAVPPKLKIYLEDQVLGDSQERDSDGVHIVDRNRNLLTQQLENTWITRITLDKVKTEKSTLEEVPVNLITIK